MTIGQRTEKAVTQSRALSGRVATHLERMRNDGELLSGEVIALQRNLKEYELELSPDDYEAWENIEKARFIIEGGGPGGDLRKLLPAPRNPAIIRLLLGKNTNIITLRREEGIKLKEEYYEFRDGNSVAFMFFSLILLTVFKWSDHQKNAQERITLSPPIRVGLQMFMCWLLYFYVGLSLRENILKANGSRVRDWWIRHHYYAVIFLLIILTLPVSSPAVTLFIPQFLTWCVAQGVVLILQNRYQRRRMYTRIALGKSSNMDVVAGESSGTSGQLLILYPLLFGLQGFQLIIAMRALLATWPAVVSPEGWLDMEASESDLWGRRGLFASGLLFLVMGMGNVQATVKTIREKRRYAKQQELHKLSRHEAEDSDHLKKK